jgi:hypothetical protein
MLFLAGTVLLVLAHRQGVRVNWQLARRLAGELEAALKPADATYTWIGGAIGFHATYELAPGIQAKATVTLLPRQSPFYLPVAQLLGRYDRLELSVLGLSHVEAPREGTWDSHIGAQVTVTPSTDLGSASLAVILPARVGGVEGPVKQVLAALDMSR